MSGKAISASGALIAAGVIALSAALPAGAQATATTVRGAVVAKDVARGTLVIAAPGGQVRTLRPAGGVRRYRVGARITAAAAARADGTYDAGRVSVVGRTGGVRVRAVLIARRGGDYLVSAGSSTFSVRRAPAPTPRRRPARIAGAASGSVGLAPGAVVVSHLTLGGGGPSTRSVIMVGAAAVTEMEGILLSADQATLELAVAGRRRVSVNLPPGLAVAAAPGEEVEVLVSVADDGAFTLVALSGEDETGGINFDADEGGIEVEGVLSALAEGSVSVAAGATGTVGCSVPAEVSLAGFAVGDAVEMECALRAGAFELRELESEHAEIEVGGVDEDEDDDEDVPALVIRRAR